MNFIWQHSVKVTLVLYRPPEGKAEPLPLERVCVSFGPDTVVASAGRAQSR